MIALRRAGKFVECYLETAGEGSNGTLAYYLATACETIHLAPAGDLNLIGLYAESRFLRGTLDKLKVVPDFNRVGRYKSAVETYTQNQYTPGGPGGDRRGARRLLRADRLRRRRGAPQERRRRCAR